MRRRSSRVERQRRLRLIVIWTAVGVTVLVVGVLIYGLGLNPLIKGRRPVARVNGVTITAGDLREQIDFLQRFYMMPITQEYLDFVLNDILIREELVRQEARRRELVVTNEDVQREIEEQQGYYRDGTPTPEPTLPATSTPVATTAVTASEVLTPAPTVAPIPTSAPMTAEGFRESYEQLLATRGITDAEFRKFVRDQLLYQALVEDFRKDVPAVLDQVHLRYLQVSSGAQAEDLAARLSEGASFEVLREEVASDEASPGYGTDLQWYTQETLAQELGSDVADRAFGMDSGVFSQESEGVYYVVEVVSHEMREVDDSLADQLASAALLDWIESQQALVEYFDYDTEYVLVEPPATPESQMISP